MKRTLIARIVLALGLGLTLVAVCLSLNPGPALSQPQANELHVCPVGCPYSSVQAAVDAANEGDIIKVAMGYYPDAHPTTLDTSGGGTCVMTTVVLITKTVTVAGGYTTTDWTTSYPVTQPTTLDAQRQGRVVHIAGNISPTIEGLNITGGYLPPGGYQCGINDGAGVWILSSSITMSRNYIFDNYADENGGGVALHYGSKVLLTGNTIVSNASSFIGGGLYMYFGQATLYDNVFISNTTNTDAPGKGGGGAYIAHGEGTLIGNTFRANRAMGLGGGLAVYDNHTTIASNTFENNYARHYGGGVDIGGDRAITLSASTIISNTAASGGGLRAGSKYALLDRNLVSFNHSTGQGGGGIFLQAGTATNNIVTFNTADKVGGGLYVKYTLADPTLVNTVIADNHAQFAGSGIYVESASPSFLHTTLARNIGGDSSGVSLNSGSTVTMTNTILVSQTAGITVAAGNLATLDGILWFGNGANTGGDGIITVTHEITGDPAFAPDGYHLTAASAAIDQGVDAGVTTDIDNQPRPQGNAPDLGADEYWLLDKHLYLPLVLRQSP